MSADTPQVLVVGAGPVGSALALELAHHGVRSIVVDRSLTASRHPKMDFVNARSMELFARLKLTDEIRELGVPSDHAFNFLWTEEFTEAPISEWRYPSVDELRAQATNDGTAPREPYQRVLGSLLEELGRQKCRASAPDQTSARAGPSRNSPRTRAASRPRSSTRPRAPPRP